MGVWDDLLRKARDKLWWIKTVFVALSILLLGFTCVFNAFVPSGSMENTIMGGDRVVGLRVAYIFAPPARGDIVIFNYPDDESVKYIKRIIGLPGETVSFKDGDVYINDTLLEEDYTKTPHSTYCDKEFSVPQNSYFLLGDNRENSKDSRYWSEPYVKRGKILAKAIISYYGTYNKNGQIKQGFHLKGL